MPADPTGASPTSAAPLSPPASPPASPSPTTSPRPASALPVQHPPLASTLRAYLRHASLYDAPGTPDMSPANDVHHHPQATAEAFMRRIFTDWDAHGTWTVEDAGVELLCLGWSGAVVEDKCGAAVEGDCGGDGPHALDDRATLVTPLSQQPRGTKRALFVHMPASCDRTQLRDHILTILDAASERVSAQRVVFCLERSLPDLSSLLHGLCYVGGEVATTGTQRDPWTGAHPLASVVLVSVPL
ncbi:hypothetical protein MSPP1_003147 [Malassezia sp. CBS 17886]|nr:hypothetical protein MSPP1_003147 [Malassezia sp. CBS 17886]